MLLDENGYSSPFVLYPFPGSGMLVRRRIGEPTSFDGGGVLGAGRHRILYALGAGFFMRFGYRILLDWMGKGARSAPFLWCGYPAGVCVRV